MLMLKSALIHDVANCRYGDMFVFSSDSVITRSLEYYGEWSEHEISVLSGYIDDYTAIQKQDK